MVAESDIAELRVPPDPRDFSVVLGGPLYQLLRRVRLSDDALHLLRQRVLAFVAITWLPLLLLSGLGGTLLPGTASPDALRVPFLYDIAAHVRFLVALPLLILAELIVHLRVRALVSQFVLRALVPPEGMQRFSAAMHSATQLRDSLIAELLILGFVYLVGVQVIWSQFIALAAPTWYAMPGTGYTGLSSAGLWLCFVSLPLFQFLLFRWYWRLFIWARFLWQVSRIRLSLFPTHPDGAGGLAFLSGIAFAIGPLAAAHGALLAATIADQIFFLGARLTDFAVDIALTTGFVLALALAPLLAFMPQLLLMKRAAMLDYEALAQTYVRGFDAKWIKGAAPPGEALVGSADLQSLADLGNSLAVARDMNLVPVTKTAVLQVAMNTLIPVAPLVLTMVPIDQLAKMLLGILF